MSQGEAPQATRLVSPRVLSANARAGLDAARAVSAVYVVIHHIVGSMDVPRLVDVLFSFGQEAVLVFFLLSGFVIFANEESRSAHPRGYYLRRLRRIYPPILLAMSVSLVCWATGVIDYGPTWREATATLLSLQDISVLKPGVISDPFMGNDPLWSLSYEVFFYLIFPVVMVGWRVSERATRHTIGAVACIAYVSYMLIPNHASLVVAYFLVWWVGAMAAKAHLDSRFHYRQVLPELSWMTGLAGIAAIGVLIEGNSGLGYYPVLMARHFFVALFLLIALLTPLRHLLGATSRFVKTPAQLISSISFGLYVLHYPLLIQSGATTDAWFVPMIALTIALAWVADRAIPTWIPKAPRD